MRNFLAILLLWSVSACWVPAHAHAILVDSVPEIGAAVTGGHVALRLRFNSRIDRARSRLTLVGPGHGASVLPILPEGTDRWNSDSSGHDYRFHHNLPKVIAERQAAEEHGGNAEPYNPINDLERNSSWGEAK